MADLIGVFFAAFCISWACSALMRRYAIARAMLDVPNARSSHSVPTPRGGGVAFVFSFLLGLLALNFLGRSSPVLGVAAALGGGLVALVGFRDDRHPLSVWAKFIWHCLAAGVALVVLGGWPLLLLTPLNIAWGALGYVAGALLLVWATNLYNFMDGLDGLAISESVFLALGSALIIVMAGGAAHESLLLGAACLGFAFHNWPPAKLFMGDAGSGFLGFTFAVIALDSTAALQTSVWPWLILPAVFIVDASYTLLYRLLTGQRWYEAHRSHAYQRAAQRLGSHRPVTMAVQAINICWLLPLACAAQRWPSLGGLLALFAWGPLVLIGYYLRAGMPIPPSAIQAAEDSAGPPEQHP